MRTVFVLAVFTAFASCSNHSSQSGPNDKAPAEQARPDTFSTTARELASVARQQYYIWTANSEEKAMTKNPSFKESYRNADTLLSGLNAMFPEVGIERTGQSGDTLYTRIKNSQRLTDGMGSAGAESYIAQAVLNLTAVPGVRWVRIDFEPGEHAEPGVWSRQDFSDYKEQR